MKLQMILAALFAVASTTANAGVIYEWVTVKNDMPVGVGLTFEVEESVVRSGSFSLELGPGEGLETVPKTGLLSFRFSDLVISNGTWLPTQQGYFSMHLNFVNNNFFAAGQIKGMNFGSKINMYSNTVDQNGIPVFTIYETNGDSMTPCASEPNSFCAGATGYLRQVPEPTSIALLGLGVIGALAARRRKPG